MTIPAGDDLNTLINRYLQGKADEVDVLQKFLKEPLAIDQKTQDAAFSLMASQNPHSAATLQMFIEVASKQLKQDPKKNIFNVLKDITKSKVAEAQELIPVTEKLLKSVTEPVFQAIKPEDNPAALIPALFEISSDERVKFLTAIKEYPASLLQKFAAVTLKERIDIIRQLALLLGETSVSNRRLLLQGVDTIPTEELAEILSFPLLVEAMNVSSKLTILKALPRIPANERSDVLRLVQQASQEVSHRAFILLALSDMPAHEREAVVREASLLLVGIRVDIALYDILGAVHEIPSHERAEVVRLATPLCHQISPDESRREILEAIRTIAPNEREELFRNASPLFVGITTSSGITQILDTIRVLPAAERAAVIGFSITLTAGIRESGERAGIINAIRAIAANDRNDRIAAITPLLSEFISAESRILLLQGKSQQEVTDAVEATSSLLEGIGDSDARIDIVNAFLAIPFAERVSRVNEIAPFLDEFIRPAERIRLLQGVSVDALRFEVLSGHEPYTLTLTRKTVKENPLEVLSTLSKEFKSHSNPRSMLTIQFQGEDGVDAGGMSRDFISLLFHGIKTSCLLTKRFIEEDNKLCRPKLLDANHLLSAEDKIFYRQLGELMMFCLNSITSYPIGMIFDLSVFVALTKFQEAHLASNFDSLDCKELVSIFIEMFKHDEAQKSLVKSMETALRYLPLPHDASDETLQEAFSLVEYEEGMEDIEEPRKHVQAIESAVRKMIMNVIKPTMVPLIELAKAMKDAPFQGKNRWELLQKKAPSEVSIALQGAVTKEDVTKRLHFTNIPDEIEEWMKEWINEADDQKLKNFVYVLSGSPALGEGAEITIQRSERSLLFHTCSLRIDINPDYNTIREKGKSGLFELLNAGIKNIMDSGGFFGEA